MTKQEKTKEDKSIIQSRAERTITDQTKHEHTKQKLTSHEG